MITSKTLSEPESYMCFLPHLVILLSQSLSFLFSTLADCPFPHPSSHHSPSPHSLPLLTTPPHPTPPHPTLPHPTPHNSLLPSTTPSTIPLHSSSTSLCEGTESDQKICEKWLSYLYFKNLWRCILSLKHLFWQFFCDIIDKKLKLDSGGMHMRQNFARALLFAMTRRLQYFSTGAILYPR